MKTNSGSLRLELGPRGMLVALVARIATNRHMAAEIILVDRRRHNDHLSSGGFFRLFVRGEITLHVAELAVLAQGKSERAHRIANR